jgi:hypothetical protein
MHVAAAQSVVTTWKKAIRNGNFITWPGIDDLSIDLHLPKSIASAKGHLNQERKNLQSTRVPLPAQDQNNDQSEDTFFPVSDSPNLKSFAAIAMIVPFTAKNTAYHDLTGRFPHRSSCGNEYLLIVYDYDGNSILQCPLKNKSAGVIKRGWISIHERLARGGNQPLLYILDNEASAKFKKRSRISTCSATCSSTQCGRARNPNIQEPFPRFPSDL